MARNLPTINQRFHLAPQLGNNNPFAKSLFSAWNSICICAIGLTIFGCQSNHSLPIQRKTIVESVYASGTTQAKGLHQVVSTVEGQIVKLKVQVGDTINAGQELMQIARPAQDSRLHYAQQAQQQAALNAAQNSPILSEMQASLASLYRKQQQDSTNLARAKRLMQQQIGTQAELERLQLALDITQNEISALQQRITSRQETLRLELANAKLQQQLATQDRNYFAITSQVAGTVYQLDKQLGESVRKGEVVAQVGATGQPYLQLAVDQLDIGRIQVGQRVLAKLDLTGNRVFSAYVAKIYPAMNTRDQSFRVDAHLADTTTGFPSQFILAAVEANIVLDERKNALVIPKEALAADKTVRVLRDGKTQSVAVQLGLQNAEEVEILSGVDANDQLLIPQP